MSHIRDVSRRLYLCPIGIRGRHRPWYFLNLRDRGRTLRDAVGGKVVLVTGASSGIGQDLAVRVGGAGANVLLVARRVERLLDTQAAIEAVGGTAFIHAGDLSDIEDVERLSKEVLHQHSQVDVLVNNAGRSIRRPLALSYDRFHDFERTMQLNYFGSLRLTLALLPTMRRRRSGHIVNVSSGAVLVKLPEFTSYVASKAALEAFSDCAAVEMHDDNVQFTTVYMPLVRTPAVADMPMWQPFPALTLAEATDVLCDAITFKPKRIGSLADHAGAWARRASPTTADRLLNLGYRISRLRSAAREASGSPAPRPVQRCIANTHHGPTVRQ